MYMAMATGIISNITLKGEKAGWGITIKKVEPIEDARLEKDLKNVIAQPSVIATDICKKPVDADVVIRKVVTNNAKNSPVRHDLPNTHKIWCKRPVEPKVDQKLELDKHRHNIRTIMQNSNASPFRAYHVDDGFACCFCCSFFEKAADLKRHTNEKHIMEKDKFKENSTSIFTYVVKLDITGLCCKICNMEMNTLENLIVHLKSHEIVLHTDIKSQIVCFKFETETIRCMFCSQEFSNFKFLLEHMNNHYRNYICAYCNAGFINYRMLVAHADGHDLTVGELKCPICNEIFEKHDKFKRHELLAHSGFDLTTHRCTHCRKKFMSDELLRNHVIKEHKGRHEYICGGCKKVYSTKSLLIAHTRRVHLHEEKHFRCDVCGRSFYERHQLKNHMLRHYDPRQFECDMCAKMFKSKQTLIGHIRTHKLKGEFKCLSCEETFFRKTYLDDHMRQVHLNEARTKCHACGKAFYESQLKHHIARRHSDLVTFECEVCNLACESKRLLIQHMATHKSFKPQSKNYECLACGKKFDRKIYVTKHTQRVHLLEKNFVCDQCGRKFADTTALKNHLATHSSAAKFQCFACPRAFKTKKTMMNHARNHMDDRKVKCEICHLGFIYPYLLKEHMKQIHKI